MFGYFSLIGLLKLHTLTSDYYMALKTIECIDLDVTKQVRSALPDSSVRHGAAAV